MNKSLLRIFLMLFVLLGFHFETHSLISLGKNQIRHWVAPNPWGLQIKNNKYGFGRKVPCRGTDAFEKLSIATLHNYLLDTLPKPLPTIGPYQVRIDYRLDRGLPFNNYFAEVQIGKKKRIFAIGVYTGNVTESGICTIKGKVSELENGLNEEWQKDYVYRPNVYHPEELMGFDPDFDFAKNEILGHWYNYYNSATLERGEQDEYILTFTGEFRFQRGSMAAFIRALEVLPEGKDIIINLDSWGGNEFISYMLRQEIAAKCRGQLEDGSPCKKCTITTHVGQFRSCRSACVGIYAIGDQKTYAESARFGFHGVHHVVDGSFIEGAAEKVLKEWGFNSDWVYQQTEKGYLSRQEFTLYSGQELHDSGLFDERPKIPSCKLKMKNQRHGF